MEVVQQTISYARPDVYTIWSIGDIHAGSRQCDETLLGDTIKRIQADRHALWIGLGDYADWINTHDMRFDLRGLAPWLLKTVADEPITRAEKHQAGRTIAQLQRDWLKERLEPIAGKCLGLVVGNHEEASRLRYDDGTAYTLSTLLNVPYLGVQAYVKVRFDRKGGGGSSLVLYVHHGYGGASTPSGIEGMLNRLMLAHPLADVVMIGHGHKQHIAEPIEVPDIKWDAEEPLQYRIRRAFMTGPFKRTCSRPGETPTWEETKGFKQGVMGSPRILYRPDTALLEIVS